MQFKPVAGMRRMRANKRDTQHIYRRHCDPYRPECLSSPTQTHTHNILMAHANVIEFVCYLLRYVLYQSAYKDEANMSMQAQWATTMYETVLTPIGRTAIRYSVHQTKKTHHWTWDMNMPDFSMSHIFY